MANPENLKPWKPGQTGNPRGYSNGRRVANALTDLIAEKGLDRDLALVIIAMASGQKHLLRQQITDPATGRKRWVRRRPDVRWMNMLLDRTEGKVPDVLQMGDAGASKDKAKFDEEADLIYGSGDEAVPGDGEGAGVPEGPDR